MVTLQEFIALTDNHRNLKLIEGDSNEPIFVGFSFLLTDYEPGLWERVKGYIVQRFVCTEEIRRKDWKEARLTPPLQPYQTADYEFTDMRMTLYYEVHIEKGESSERRNDGMDGL